MAQGSYNKPKLPGIPGIKEFWTPAGMCSTPLGLRLHRRRRQRRPAQAGRQAGRAGHRRHGVQLVPHLGRDAEALFVFQRTPSSVDTRANTPTDATWAAALQPGWQAGASATSTTGRRSSAWSSVSPIWSATSGPNSGAT
jgi:cyclohexanone monooxygenase